MLPRARLALLLAVVLSTPLTAARGTPAFRRLAIPDDVPAHLCSALAQDRFGFVWMGTQGGLVRYDGYQFRVFRPDPANPHAIAGSYIRALLAASDGRIWAGTFSSGVSVYDPATDHFVTYSTHADAPARISHDRVEGLAEDRDGRIWIATYEGLDRFDPKTQRIDHFYADAQQPHSLADNRTRGLLIDRTGQLWVGTRAGLQVRRGESTFEAVASDAHDPSSLAGQFVAKLFEDSRGRIWIGTTENGAAVLDPRTGTLRRITTRTAGSDFWVYGIEEAPSGEIWIATFGGGIAIVDPDSLALVATIRHDPALEDTIGGDRLGALLKDRSGVIWAGTWGQGIARHDPTTRAFRALRHSPNRPTGLSHPAAVRALQMNDGTVWVGTNGNGIDVVNLSDETLVGSFRPRRDDGGALSDGSITCLAQGADGAIWVATLDGVLHRLRPHARRFERLSSATGLPGGPIRALTFGPAGELWAGSAEGLARIDPVSLHTTAYRHHPGDPTSLAGHAVEAIAFDRRGTMWVGTDSGLNVFDPVSGKAIRIVSDPVRDDSLPNNWVPDLLLASDGRLWVATQGGAAVLTEWDGQQARFDRLARHVRDLTGPAEALIEDGEGKIWIGPSVRIDPRTWQAERFGPADGRAFRNYFIASRARTADGELMFGSPEGLLVVQPALIAPWSFQPTVAITAVALSGASPPAAAALPAVSLRPPARGFRVDFAALDFTAPERNVYRYRLDGFDADWTLADATSRSVSYTNLPPGRYTFRVAGSNRSGAWSPTEATLAVTVIPAFYETGWFQATLSVGLGAFVYAGYRLRLRRLQARSEALERLVGERTAELRQAYTQIEEASLTDALTGLRNRRFLQQAILPELALAIRGYEGAHTTQDRDLIFFLLDLDHFKEVNDRFGHAAGDAVLTQTAAVLRRTVRSSDFIVRWGGEEFLVVSRLTDRALGSEIAEKIRAAIAEHEFTLPDHTVLRRTCSIGYATFPFSATKPRAVAWDDVVVAADHALYAAKRAGRNRAIGLVLVVGTDPAEAIAAIKDDLEAASREGAVRIISGVASESTRHADGAPQRS